MLGVLSLNVQRKCVGPNEIKVFLRSNWIYFVYTETKNLGLLCFIQALVSTKYPFFGYCELSITKHLSKRNVTHA